MKRILIISTSPRVHSNSEALALEFAKGAADKGNEVEFISLRGKTINFCKGCLACQKTKRCFMRDDADIIEQKMLEADVLVFATPIYYYEMSGQMKTMLDRSNPLYTSDYKFRDVYMIATAADDGDEVCNRAVSGLEGWIECFPEAKLSGVVFQGDVTDVNTVKDKQGMQKAYDMGYGIK